MKLYSTRHVTTSVLYYVQVLLRVLWSEINKSAVYIILCLHCRQEVIEGVLDPWLDCCLNARCIQEPGLSRKNHQYEQAALTVVAYKFGVSLPQVRRLCRLHFGYDH